MRKNIRLVAVLFLAAFLLGGCGTPMYEMTEEEEGLVVQYAAYALAKHNIYQKDGMTDAVPQDTETETEVAEESDTQEQASQQPDSASGDSQAENQAVSIAKAIGLEGEIEVSYLGSSVKDTYQEGTYFSVNASENKKLVVMEFKLKNTSGQAIKVDTSSSGSSFFCSFDGEKQISEKKTFGGRILSSFSGKIKAGESKKLYLIFEVPENVATNSQSGDLFVTIGEQTYPVKL